MSNDSTTPGYLTPVSDGPTYDEALERQISRWIRGVTGMEKDNVYPRWTDPQPQIPKNGTTWCAFGITGVQEDANPAYIQGAENAEQWSHETIDILVCFYGPQGMTVATRFRDGLFVSQNNDELKNNDLTLLDCGRIFNLPELINNQWVRRYDIAVRLRRKVIREYGIKSLVEAPVQFFGE
ncbi:phage neck terminator protein [Serratia marcescens]|uniref:phage neck terminator protein n=1 Tax=Serratia marcescens TaxID=615 RepID=UPI003D16183C